MTEAIHGPDLDDLVRRSRRLRWRRWFVISGATTGIAGAVIALPLMMMSGNNRPTAVLSEPSATATPTSSTSAPSPAPYQPAPSKFPDWGVQGGCPDRSGVVPFTLADSAAVRDARARFGGNFADEYANSDQAFWPVLKSNEAVGHDPYSPEPVTPADSTVQPGIKGDFVSYLASNCGSSLVQDSAILTVCNGRCGSSPALDETSAWINRSGHWLLWYQQP